MIYYDRIISGSDLSVNQWIDLKLNDVVRCEYNGKLQWIKVTKATQYGSRGSISLANQIQSIEVDSWLLENNIDNNPRNWSKSDRVIFELRWG